MSDRTRSDTQRPSDEQQAPDEQQQAQQVKDSLPPGARTKDDVAEDGRSQPFDEARACLSNNPQSSGGWPLSSILRNTA